MEQRVVIITGMHRSGTSLVANLLQEAGVNIGDSLVGPTKGNLRGHFEDVDFFRFHDRILHRFGQSILVRSTAALGAITPEETDEALALIRQRNGCMVWGWKDPRTSLFLDFWHNLLPQARYLFIYRHPVEVVLSLIRRSTDMDALIDPLASLRAWQVYNESILSFYARQPEVCLLCNISRITADIEAFLSLTAKKLDLPLRCKEPQQVYHAAELKQIALPEVTLLRKIAPRAVELYEQLEMQADLPQLASGQATAPEVLTFAELQNAVSYLGNGDELEVRASSLFSLLLALLDPGAIQASKKALYARLVELEQEYQRLIEWGRSHEEEIGQLKEQNQRLLEWGRSHEQEIEQLKVHNQRLLEGDRSYEQEIEQLKEQSQSLFEWVRTHRLVRLILKLRLLPPLPKQE